MIVSVCIGVCLYGPAHTGTCPTQNFASTDQHRKVLFVSFESNMSEEIVCYHNIWLMYAIDT